MLAGWLTGACLATGAEPAFWSWANTPPMGWNSWDCYGAGVWETNVIANADYMAAHLKAHGWNVVTIDIQWYEPLAHTTEYRKGALLEMDDHGRLLPAANRFPSTQATRSFKPVADYLHQQGLKFGLHLLRGIPRLAVDRDNAPILGTSVKAADIADRNSKCPWNDDMYGVDMTRPGAQEYYDSVFALLASWDLDYVKVDDLSAPYHTAEIEAIRRAIDKTGRPIVFSTSPGATPVDQGAHVQTHANLWRISNDFWDDWRALYSQFARLDRWTPYRGGGHWPDADMLPLGNVRAWQDRDAWTHFTHDELYTLLSLWCIARSPLILGGNLPKNDDFTLALLTNDEVIRVNQASLNNRQVCNQSNHIAWVADVPGSPDKYVALFNAAPTPAPGRRRNEPATNPAEPPPAPTKVTVALTDLGLQGACAVRDLWSHQDLAPATGEVSATVNPHGAVLLRLRPAPAAPAGKVAPRPLYRDPPFDAPTDPVLCFNAEANKWFMYYTARRATATNAPGVTWVHGSNIGMAESADGGATWTYKGPADIRYGKDEHPNDYTYWAPEVIWVNGVYHMFLSFVPGIFTDWNHPRQIIHLTSHDGVKWDALGPVDLKSDRVIDACVMQIPDGRWRMWYKDERARRSVCYADSPDLVQWEPKGSAVTNFSGEGPKAFHWQNAYWLIADCWANGMRVWQSTDCPHWKLQDVPLPGSHGDVVVSGDRAWWFFFGPGRHTAIEVVELSVTGGKLIPSDRNQPTYIDLKPEREPEK